MALSLCERQFIRCTRSFRPSQHAYKKLIRYIIIVNGNPNSGKKRMGKDPLDPSLRWRQLSALRRTGGESPQFETSSRPSLSCSQSRPRATSQNREFRAR